ncbi:MAG TPA: hypothetical protein VNM14_20995 [Planctomycetota bacterium]|jgi:hypothetical protein|nr:hypothetical protein [Planctomycetota bacterium]
MNQQPFRRPGARVYVPSPASPAWMGLAVVLALMTFIGSCCFLVVRWIDKHTHYCPTTRR